MVRAAQNAFILPVSDSVAVSDTVIRVRDIATISSELPESVKDEIGLFPIGESAPPGAYRYIDLDRTVTYYLNPRWESITFKVPDPKRIKVATNYIEKRVGEFETKIHDYYKQHVQWKSGDWNLAINNPENALRCLDKPLIINIKGDVDPYVRGNHTVTIIAKQGGKRYRMPIRCSIRVSTNVVTAGNTIKKGSQLSDKNCAVQRRDITRMSTLPFLAVDSLIHLKTIRTIAAGDIILNHHVKPIPIVNKGDIVYITKTVGRVRVSVQAIARESGNNGERIWVENAQSHRLVRTIIQGKRKVIPAEGGNVQNEKIL